MWRWGSMPSQAAARLERYGPNRLPAGKQRGPLMRFLLQIHNVLIYVLLGAAGVTALLGDGWIRASSWAWSSSTP